MSDDTKEYARQQLYLTTLALSLPAQQQLALFSSEPWIQRANELAIEFDNALKLYRSWHRDVPEADMLSIVAIDTLLIEMSDLHDEALWTDQGVESRKEWENIRTLAKMALASPAMEWSSVSLSRLDSIFGPLSGRVSSPAVAHPEDSQ